MTDDLGVTKEVTASSAPLMQFHVSFTPSVMMPSGETETIVPVYVAGGLMLLLTR